MDTSLLLGFFKGGHTMLEKYNDVLTVEEVCEILKIGKRLAYTLLQEGVIPSRRLGRIYRIPKIGVINYLMAQG